MPAGWSRESKSRAEMARYVRARIEELLGKPLPIASRIDCMTKAIINAADQGRIIKPENRDFPEAVQAVMDLVQLSFILERLEGHHVSNETLSRIKQVIRDSIVPVVSGQSPGRDYQFELFVNAICDLSGLKPDLNTKSGDIRVRHGRFEYCFECKRIKSIDKLEANARQARKQIEASGLPGLIWMDLTVATNPGLDVIVVDANDEMLMKAGHWQLRRLMDRYYNSIRSWTNGSDVVGVMLVNHVLHSSPRDGDWALNTFYYSVPLLDESELLRVRAEKLLAAIRRGVNFITCGSQ